MYLRKGMRGVAPVISTVVLLTVLLAATIAALYYVGIITMQTHASGEAKMAKDSLVVLAEQIERIKGAKEATYKITLSTRYGVPNVMDGGTLAVSFDGDTLSFDQYVIRYSIPQNFFTEEPEELSGPTGLIVSNEPIPHVYTYTSGDFWIVELETVRIRLEHLYTEETPSGSREVYAVNIIVLRKGEISETSGASTMYVYLRVSRIEYMSLSDVSTISITTSAGSDTATLTTPNVILVTISYITVNIGGGIGG